MIRRWTMLAGALAIALAAPQAGAAVAAPSVPDQKRVVTQPASDADDGLDRLRADAEGRLKVHRSTDGVVDFVSSANGRAMLDGDEDATPRRTAQDQLARYGEAFGIDGGLSRAVVKQTLGSSTGGSVVRVDQVVDGVPVFGGQIVMSLDEDQGLVSVDPATTEATEVPSAVVSEAKAQRSALNVTAKTHRVDADKLTVSDKGRRLYDPAIVHTTDPMGVRPVWEFEVTNGSDIQERVLVGTDRGEIALHFNNVPKINRVVCDNAGVRRTSSESSIPKCTSGAARVEGGAPAGVDVNQAYDNLGATSASYSELADIDLTALVGATLTSGQKALMSTVRWCFTDSALSCPYDNAFWDGTQMVFGSGFAAADDVVAHELTHGYVERTSGLYYYHQSGAINESVSDVIGEIVDHRNPASAADDSAWLLGEELPVVGAQRSLQDPTLYGQPDKMTSANFRNADVTDDGGAVHDNLGVGNKTAYLISQGGTFNDRTITGIDAGDAGLAKSGRLWLETIKRLTSGAQYADLGRVLAATCAELQTTPESGFTSGDCVSVADAAAATELALPPADPKAANAEAPSTCAVGAQQVQLRRDDDAVQQFGLTAGGLWNRTPANGTPNYTRSGDSSLFGQNPNPEFGTPTYSSMISSSFVVPTGHPSYTHFNHAYVFEGYEAEDGFDAWYPDGGYVRVQTLSGSTWTTRTVPWDNGPDKSLDDTATKVFGGDSRGYGSSRINLSSLAGQTVRLVFTVTGDDSESYLGWWIDDVRLYSCADPIPGAPTVTNNAATLSSATVTWTPGYAGSGVASYEVTSSDGQTRTLPSTARSATVTGFDTAAPLTVSVAAVNPEGEAGAGTTSTFYPTGTTTAVSTTSATKGKYFNVTGKVTRRGTSTVIATMPLSLQRRMWGSTTWTSLQTGSTASNGIKVWSVKHYSKATYRVVAKGVRVNFGSYGNSRVVSTR